MGRASVDPSVTAQSAYGTEYRRSVGVAPIMLDRAHPAIGARNLALDPVISLITHTTRGGRQDGPESERQEREGQEDLERPFRFDSAVVDDASR